MDNIAAYDPLQILFVYKKILKKNEIIDQKKTKCQKNRKSQKFRKIKKIEKYQKKVKKKLKN